MAQRMKLDAVGDITCTGPGDIHVFSASGSRIDVIETSEVVGNVAWGGEERRELRLRDDLSVSRDDRGSRSSPHALTVHRGVVASRLAPAALLVIS